MQTQKFFLVLLALIFTFSVFPFPVFATAPTLTSVSGSPNPAYSTESVLVSSVSSGEIPELIFDGETVPDTGFGYNSIGCIVFEPTNTYPLDWAKIEMAGTHTAADTNGYMYSVIDENPADSNFLVNELLASSQTIEQAGTVITFSNFDNNIYLQNDRNYAFCITTTAGSSTIRGTTTNTDSRMRFYYDQGATFPILDTGTNNRDARLDVNGVTFASTKLKCGQSTGTYDLCTSSSSTYYNPFCSFSNPFSSGSTDTVYCVSYNTSTLENSTEKTFSLVTQASLSDSLSCSGITNSTCSVSDSAVNVDPTNESNELTFSVSNTSYDVINGTISILNSLNDSKQYFVYTSSDGTNWTFNDTLTFGSDNNNPVQKIWSTSSERYLHSITTDFQPIQTIYIKLVYSSVPVYWETIGSSSDWGNLNPSSIVVQNNGLHYMDLFQDSNYTPIQSYTLKPYPDLTSASLSQGFEIQFTAYATYTTTLNVGERVGTTDTTTAIMLTTTPTRYSVFVSPSNYESQLLFLSNGNISNQVYISDYAIIPKAYFLDRLELYNQDGSDLYSVAVDGTAYTYIQEASKFLEKTSAYNQNGQLSKMVTQILIGSTIIKSYETDLTNQTSNVKIDLSRVFEGITDYNGQSFITSGTITNSLQPLRDLTVKNILVDSSDNNVAEQSQTIKLLQYPYFPNDLKLNIYPTQKKVGENPAFDISIQQRLPSSFIGIKFIIYDSTHSVTNPNYSETIYAQDLGCETLITCQKQIKINSFVFPDDTVYTEAFGVILNTEPQNFDNPLTVAKQSILTSYVDFETARILQVFERENFQYKNTEPIPLVLQVRDDSLQNLQSDYEVFMEIDVNDNGAYSTQLNKYYPIQFYYDDTTGYNYWFWNNLFLQDDGSLIPDGNAVRIKAYIVPVKTGVIPTGFSLTKKCLSYPSDYDFGDGNVSAFFKGSYLFNWAGVLGDYVYGCQTESPTLVYYNDDPTYVKEIDINENYSPVGGQNESVFCLRTDQNYSYKQELGDSFVCGVMYLKSEQQIDGFRVYLGNGYSDYAKEGDEAQYISFDIPTDEVMFNDILMLRSALQTEYSTTKIHTFGGLLAAGLNQLLPLGQPLVDEAQLLSGEGVLITNTGFDINLQNQLDPTKVSGIFFFKVDGLSVINMNDYVNNNPDLETLDPKQFLVYAKANGLSVPIKQAVITLYSRDLAAKQKFKINSPLVIYEKPSIRNTINTDVNKSGATPIALKFNFIVDMFSNNNTSAMRAFVPIVFSYIVPNKTTFNFSEWLNGLWNGENGLTTNPLGFATTNWALLFVILLLIITSAWVIGQTRRG